VAIYGAREHLPDGLAQNTIIVAAAGFGLFWLIGWVFAGFFRGANEDK
jgi:hypothetical protein